MIEFIILETHPADSRIKISNDVFQTLTEKMKKGSADVPLVIVKQTLNKQ